LKKDSAAATGEIIDLINNNEFFAYSDVLRDMARSFEGANVEAVYNFDYVSTSDPDKTIRIWKSGAYCRSKLARGWIPQHPTYSCKAHLSTNVGPMIPANGSPPITTPSCAGSPTAPSSRLTRPRFSKNAGRG
jgi:hypothetical protein